MAVIDILPGIEVMVCVDDEAIAEIATDNEKIDHPKQAVRLHQQGRMTTNYIQSTTDKKFTIYIKVSEPFHLNGTDLIFNVDIDGIFVKAPLLLQEDYETKIWENEIEGPVIFHGEVAVVRPLKFAEIKTTSAQLHSKTISHHKKQLESVGLIEVSIYRASTTGLKMTQTISEAIQVETKKDLNKTYHLKAIVKENQSHRSALAEAEPAEMENMLATKKIDGDDYPIAIFKFKYRSEKALKELGVLARSPSTNIYDAPPHVALPTPATTPTTTPGPVPAPAPRTLIPPSSRAVSSAPHAVPVHFQESMRALITKHKRELDEMLEAAMKGTPKPEEVPGIKNESVPAPGVKREHPDGSQNGEPPKQRKKMIGKVTIDLTKDDEDDTPVVAVDDD